MAEEQSQPRRTQVQDTEEISQRRRLNEILKRRTAVLDTRDAAIEGLEYGDLTYERAIRLYSGKLSGLILDIYPMFSWATNDGGEPIGDQYRKQIAIDDIIIRPPPGLKTSLAHTASRVDAKRVTIQGLEWFIENGIEVAAVFDGFPEESTQKVTRRRSETIPFRTVDNGVKAVELFLHEIDIDVAFDEPEGDAGFDYSDVLEEGPPDRGEEPDISTNGSDARGVTADE